MRPEIREPIISPPRQQRGAALLILLTLVLIAASYTLLKKLNTHPSNLIRAGDTAAVLGEAKAALIGYALKSQARPGELPCPDNDNDGKEDSAPPCTGANNVTFRLPWKTLGLPDLRDSSGERLWYAVDPAFVGTAALNSDTAATQAIDGGATSYAAVIIAPGGSLQGQSRAGQQNNILRYLEADNANNDTLFVTTSAGDFNDQVLGITRDELMQAVERRVLKEVANKLSDYFDLQNYFPNPVPFGAPNCGSTTGMVPLNIAATCPSQANWGAAALPAWFTNNGWDKIIWYVVSADCDSPLPNICDTNPLNLLTVNGPAVPITNIKALLIAGGIKLPGVLPKQVRPATNINHLLDSTENKNGDNTFLILPIDATSNDQIQVVAP